MRDYLKDLEEVGQYDVRGFYYLGKETNLQAELQGWSAQTQDTQNRLRPWLTSICVNTEGLGDKCAKSLTQAEAQGGLPAFFNKYWKAAQENYDSFFLVAKSRPDVTWPSTAPNMLSLPF